MAPEPKDESKDEANKGSLCVLKGKKVGDGVVGTLTIHERQIPTPSFVIEVSGQEDFKIAIERTYLLKEPHIVSVPSYKWDSYTRNLPVAVFDNLDRFSIEFITKHHLITYEPPELYRFRMPQKLLSHALREDDVRIKKFYHLAMDEDRKDEALTLLPAFEREFIKRQLDRLLWKNYQARVRRKAPSLKEMKGKFEEPKDESDIEGAWSNIEGPYKTHVIDGMRQTIAMRVSCSFVPVVRTLKSSSARFVQRQVQNQNRVVVDAWETDVKGYYFPRGRPWFHLSLDQSVFIDSGETQPEDVIDIVNRSLDPSRHCGICVTLTDWKEAFRDGKQRTRLESFTSDLNDIAFTNGLPVYGARSKWIGMYLVDKGLTLAGSILNGGSRVRESGGGLSSNDPRLFGSVPIYGRCVEAGILDLFKTGKEIGKCEDPYELHKFDGVESKCDPLLQTSHELFRTEFAKPRRIATHVTEVREIRSALERGTFNPGKNYIGRSELWGELRRKKTRAKPKKKEPYDSKEAKKPEK